MKTYLNKMYLLQIFLRQAIVCQAINIQNTLNNNKIVHYRFISSNVVQQF